MIPERYLEKVYSGFLGMNIGIRLGAPVTPLNGENHLLVIRAQGAMRGYAGGLGEHGKAVLYKNDFGFRKLAETDFPWETGKTYNVCLQARGNEITLFLDGEPLLTAQDSSFAYGMYGCGSLTMGRTLFSSFSIS